LKNNWDFLVYAMFSKKDHDVQRYPRDMTGYGHQPPAADWPNGAKIAVQIVLNYEEGGENNILHGDPASEAFLSEITGAAPWPGQRHWNMESIYEYGSRAGFWRVHGLLRDLPITVYGVATALARAPQNRWRRCRRLAGRWPATG
jgi:peptidoglycan/xylan/chitin deacetylase (PgdA/CDA1 family)